LKELNTASLSIIRQWRAAQATSPRRALSLKDIDKKLDKAAERNGKVDAAKAKTR